jgi:TfoX/Sxy family transcriptional regulator of competence genes
MSSDLSYVEFVVDQIKDAGEIAYRKMFGEYAVYCNAKVIALICGNQFFVKPTEGGRSFIEDVVEAAPYPGAKDYFLIEDQIEDREWICRLVRITADGLPEPKLKRKKRRA